MKEERFIIDYLAAWLCLILFLAGCGNDRTGGSGDHGPLIDNEYLQSERYREFHNQTNEENKQSADERQMIRQLVLQMLAVDKLPDLSLPMTMRTGDFQHRVEEGDPVVIRDSRIRGTSLARNRFIPVGSAERNSITLLLFMVRRTSLYPDMDLFAATVRDSSVVGLASIATYKNTLSQTIRPEVTVSSDWQITSAGPRISRYPIEYENNPVWKFRIDRNGIIKEISNSE